MYRNTLYKLTWGGNVYGDKDIWSNGLHLGNDSGDVDVLTQSQMEAAVLSLSNAVSDAFSRADWGVSQYATLNWVKLAYIGTDGLYIRDATIVDFPGGIPGGNPDPIVPQNSVVVTLGTNATRGLAKNGRFYLPLSGEVNTAGVIDPSNVNNILARSRIFIEAVNEAINPFDGAASVVVASNQREGLTRRVTEVRVGNVVDTQRSRRNAFVEQYSSEDISL